MASSAAAQRGARETPKQVTTRPRRAWRVRDRADTAGSARTHRLHLSGRGRGNAAARVRDAAIGTESATAERVGAGSGEVKGGARERHRILTARGLTRTLFVRGAADVPRGRTPGRCRVLQRDPVSNLKYFQTSYPIEHRSTPFLFREKNVHNAEHPASGRTVTLAGTPGDDSSVGGVDRPPGRPRRCVAATGTRTAWRAVTPSARGEWAGASRQSATPLRAGAPGATPSRSLRRAPRARARGCAKVRGASPLRRSPPSTLFARTRGEPRALSRDSRARTARSTLSV